LSSERPLNQYNRKEIFFWLALKRIPGIGNVIYKRLIEKFHTPEGVFQATPAELKEIEGIRPKTIEAITNNFRDEEWVNRELDRVEKLGIKILTINDRLYPQILKNIYDPPPILYVKGKIKEEDRLSISIVGSRGASAYGKDITYRLTRALTQQGFTIVSGLARGIDTFAHKGALKAGGRTLAVLGSGIDVIYPWENRHLSEEISENGAVISEFALGTPPEAANFPSRNRIISGLSLGTVIIEASFRSGSLITARLALEQGREVFAVPGNVDSHWSKGTNRLIKEGAKLVTEPEDIIEEILPQYEFSERIENSNKVSELKNITPESKKILDLIEVNPTHIDTLIQKSGLSSSQVSSILLDLELKGVVKQLKGKMFKKLL
jgi:DNA processing protein